MIYNNFFEEVLFPYEEIRANQDSMIYDLHTALKEKRNLIMHAPTGIGKTASVISPSLAFALKNDLTVFFLTSRHMQHQIAIKTLKEIKSKYKINFDCVDLIGKRGMCLQSGVEAFGINDFHQYCRGLREEDKCEFYLNARNKNGASSVKSKQALEELKVLSPCNVQDFINAGSRHSICPYELGMMSGEDSRVIISDYYYIFNDSIRQGFLSKIKKNLGKCILIIDEGHNLPLRLRELMTHRLSSFILERAVRETKKFDYESTAENLNILTKAMQLFENNSGVKNFQCLVRKEEFIENISKQKNYDEIVSELSFIGEEIIESQKSSFVLSVAKFLQAWPHGENGYTRIFSSNEKNYSLMLKCLDPAITSREIIENSYASILMSGTLTPTTMYKDVLGFPSATFEKEYKSPFPTKNRLAIIVPKTTTRFSKRTAFQFKDIGEICGDICNNIPGNVLVFFPSYELMNIVGEHFKKIYTRTIFMEKKNLNKSEKEEFIERFKSYHKSGAALLAVSSGSFGEGIDMPGILKGVVVVGLPLQKPDLETKELINYYENKFGRGWDYGYVLPAITRCLQNAGRCIRSERDKGAIIFLDERYAWENYYKCFPKDWDAKIDVDYCKHINKFFSQN